MRNRAAGTPRETGIAPGPGSASGLAHGRARRDLIQWTPGAGEPEVDDPCWFEFYERVQAAGKGLVLLGGTMDPDKFEILLGGLKTTRGLFVRTVPKDEREAKEIVRIADAVGVK